MGVRFGMVSDRVMGVKFVVVDGSHQCRRQYWLFWLCFVFFFVFSFKGSIGGCGFVPVVAIGVVAVVVVSGCCCGSCTVVGGGVVFDDFDDDDGGGGGRG